MTEQEQFVRDQMAQDLDIDPETFEVQLATTDDGMKIRVTFLEGHAPSRRLLRKIDLLLGNKPKTPWAFYLFLILFAFEGAYQRSWMCLLWLIPAWWAMPKRCKGCGQYHNNEAQ